jgi:ESCRT-I complex subunit VPS28
VKLADTRAERDLQDSLAEIFSIIVTLDELEKAFLKDAIPETDYTEICERSLKQYKSILADETVARAFIGLEEFKAEWDVRYASRPLRDALLTKCSSRYQEQRSA